MAEFPSMPIWVDSFLADTAHLSDAERGRYILLLVTIWRAPACRLPHDPTWMARRFSVTVEQYRELYVPLIREFCTWDEQWIFHPGLSREREFVRRRSAANRENAKSRWEKEKG